MGLRKGKTKQLLESGIDCALLAVEIYNKPRAPFRVETFITQMMYPFNTNTDYCHYDEAHDDYLYQESWRGLIINGIQNGVLTKEQWKNNFQRNNKLNVSEIQLN